MKAIHNTLTTQNWNIKVVANLLKVKNESNSQQGGVSYFTDKSCGKSTKSKE